MKRVSRVLSIALALVVLGVSWTGVAASVSSRYVGIEVEVFRSWGLFGLGTWEALDARFVSMDIARLEAADQANLADVVGGCQSGAWDDRGSCSALSTVQYVFERHYALEPVLGALYRVTLTNRTTGLLGLVLAIDGLNTNGSAEVGGTARDKKWILLPGQTVRIAGWQVSSDEALQFRFATPSQAHSALDVLRGSLRVYVYLADPRGDAAKGTAAGAVVDQPTVLIPFASVTSQPVDIVDLRYARASVSLGILCEETGGTGIRISTVVAGTIAELRGLRTGDVITYVNGIPINTCSDLAAYLATRRPGDRVVLKVHRADTVILLTLELEE
ncbi:MAG: PDZ domain-containing protein [Candidatus Bipolaricaulis sp.]|nr:PDZ domain-containing protein [Candidatus Bipolaricaulis sp.]